MAALTLVLARAASRSPISLAQAQKRMASCFNRTASSSSLEPLQTAQRARSRRILLWPVITLTAVLIWVSVLVEKPPFLLQTAPRNKVTLWLLHQTARSL